MIMKINTISSWIRSCDHYNSHQNNDNDTVMIRKLNKKNDNKNNKNNKDSKIIKTVKKQKKKKNKNKIAVTLKWAH